jgi:hypothetical protein
VSGLRVRAAGAEDIVRPRRLIGRFWVATQLHRQAATVTPVRYVSVAE